MPRPHSERTHIGTTIYRYMDRELTRDELRADVEAQAAGLDHEQWIGGEFNFDDWLVDSLRVGTIERGGMSSSTLTVQRSTFPSITATAPAIGSKPVLGFRLLHAAFGATRVSVTRSW